jgi:NADPH:quinone reductase-like Zn-dependent oxidoreductase
MTLDDRSRLVRTLEVQRDDLRVSRVVEQPLPTLSDGQVLLGVDRVGLTANNVTYGVTGESLGYWQFFPAEGAWGRLPTWGFATVVASATPGVATGTRLFGYLPLGTHLVVEPTRTGSSGFTDGSAHRAALPGPYNAYRAVDADVLHRPDAEDAQAVLLPLYLTSFVLEDYLADQAWFDASRVLLTSASAKTTLGTAMLASRRPHRPRVVGLTSARNVAFVQGLGCYDEVLTYDGLGSLDTGVPSVLVDVAGDQRVRDAVHASLGDRLRASIAVGLSHWDSGTPSAPPSGPRPTFFFAPSQVDKRVADWGAGEYQRRLSTAWHALVDETLGWLTIREVDGIDAAPDALARLLEGSVDPREAFVVVCR